MFIHFLKKRNPNKLAKKLQNNSKTTQGLVIKGSHPKSPAPHPPPRPGHLGTGHLGQMAASQTTRRTNNRNLGVPSVHAEAWPRGLGYRDTSSCSRVRAGPARPLPQEERTQVHCVSGSGRDFGGGGSGRLSYNRREAPEFAPEGAPAGALVPCSVSLDPDGPGSSEQSAE